MLTAVALGASLAPGAEARLAWAVASLATVMTELRVASLVRSPAVGPPQPDILNTVVLGHSPRRPEALLAFAKRLELVAGRRPGERWGPRRLDLDLLLWGSEQRSDVELTLPHPALRQRRFVLAPLVELAPDLVLPPDGVTAADALAALGPSTSEDAVTAWSWPAAPAAAAPVTRGTAPSASPGATAPTIPDATSLHAADSPRGEREDQR